MECALCKVQYIGKAETAFKIRLNNHRKDIINPKSISEICISENLGTHSTCMQNSH